MSSIEIEIANESTCKTNEKQEEEKGRAGKVKVDEADEEEEKGKHEKKYADLAKQIGFLKKFDWFDANNPLIKAPPIKLLTPIAFWFMCCSEYFPRSLSVGSDPSRSLTEVLQKIERQPVSQIIRIKDLSQFSPKVENVSEQIQEKITNIHESIKQLRPDRQLGNLRSLAELKEEYTSEDDEFIISTRCDLMELYRKYIQAQSGENSQCDCKKSDKPCSCLGKAELDEESQEDSEEILSAMKKQDIDSLVNLYHHHLEEEQKVQSVRIDNLKARITEQLSSERIIYPSADEIDFQDILVDIHSFNQVELEYLNHLENKSQVSDAFIPTDSAEQPGQSAGKKQTFSKRTETAQVMEDLACQICNDGDYNDDDLIVFCSKCNVSVHQRCYGIPRIPTDDWVCELCLSFGPEGKYLQCALCTQRGGAMKPSKLSTSSQVLAQYNVAFSEFCKTCPVGPPNKKQRYSETEEAIQKVVIPDEEDGEKENNLYYDFHTLNKFSQEELKNQPKPYFMWCHVSCALWTPECFFDDKNLYSNVKGIENIDKQRFKLECSVCHQKKAGSCIQCAKTKCMEAFHPECARRANVFMEIRNADKLAYLIYCDKHTPLKLRRTIDQKEKKYKEEIVKFCKSIEKSRENRNKERLTKKEKDKTSQKEINNKETKKKKIFVSAKKIRLQISKNEEDIRKEELEFQKVLALKIIEFLDAHPERESKLKNKEVDDKNSKQISGQSKLDPHKAANKLKKKKEEPASTNNKLARWQQGLFIKKDEEIWKEVEFKQYSPNQIFKRYKRIIRDKDKRKAFKVLYYQMLTTIKGIRILSKEERLKEKEKKLLEKNLKKQQKINEIQLKASQAAQANKSKSKKQNKKGTTKQKGKSKDQGEEEDAQTYEDSEKLYCVCQKKYKEGDPMMACERCDEWYHVDCVGYIGTMQYAEQMEFICKFCDNKDDDSDARKMRKEQYGDKFIDYDTPDYKESKQLWIQRKKTIAENKKALKNKRLIEKKNDKNQNNGKELKGESILEENLLKTQQETLSTGTIMGVDDQQNKISERNDCQIDSKKRKNSKSGEDMLRKQIKTIDQLGDKSVDGLTSNEMLQQQYAGGSCNDCIEEEEENKQSNSIETLTNLNQITNCTLDELENKEKQGQLQTQNILQNNLSEHQLVSSEDNKDCMA